MRTRAAQPFTTIHTEGGLLPVDLLLRVTSRKTDLEGTTPESYHLTGTERIPEAITRAWNRLTGAWASFRVAAEKLSPDDPATGLTRERWLLVLFQELGYGRLQPTRAVEIDGRTYPISHFWGRTPIHLVGRGVDLDTRARGVAGAARISPHGLIQEFLNRSQDHVWGFVSNGLALRLLRDNASLTRLAYVEFDLKGMMEGEVYADFALLWMLCHQSRAEGERPEDCWLERWARAAREQGTRALDSLRQGVEGAIKALGAGFLKHPDNRDLRERLRSGTLSKLDYYRQALRLVYRLLFLFVAEDRGLLLDPGAAEKAQWRYREYYSTVRLRRLAGRRRGTRHHDLYGALRLVMEKLGLDVGCPPLALPALGSFLWSDGAIPDLIRAEIANQHLLEAVHALAFTTQDGLRRGVDYRNLGSEELGSVYESLLELHPDVDTQAHTFELKAQAGSERKTTGSYYTPPSLVHCLLDSALDPVLDEAARQSDPERSILSLKICDPACGSGHFLIAAAHRIARRLASCRIGDEEPSPEATRGALREVIRRCIHGVDLNEMAVELCKVSLWMESIDPGKPLSFLDDHILCGNSLFGTTPALMRQGIPDDAFKPIEGDERQMAAALKRQNRAERKGQARLPLVAEPKAHYGSLTETFDALEAIEDESMGGIHEQERRYHAILQSTDYRKEKLAADAWCAAFVWRKTATAPPAITHDTFLGLSKDPTTLARILVQEINLLAGQYGFFHWHLAFPRVFRVRAGEGPENEQAGWNGGFDVVLGNPPWEHTELKEKEWFAVRQPEIAAAATADERKRKILDLRSEDSDLYLAFQEAKRVQEGISHFATVSGRNPLCGRGRINTYTIFAETMRLVVSGWGRVGCIVPSGIATDDTTKFFFQDVMSSRGLVSLYDFENREGLFPAVDSRMKFCLLTMTGSSRPTGRGTSFIFFAQRVSDLTDENRRFTMSSQEIANLNPNTRTCPIFRTRRDVEITKAIYQRVPVLVREGPPEANPWSLSFKQGLFNMAGDSGHFRTREDLERAEWQLEGNIFHRAGDRYLPLYEAKMIHQFDHRWATYEAQDIRELEPADKKDPLRLALPRYWVPSSEVDVRLHDQWDRQWLPGWRDITNTTNERTVIASILPRVGVGHQCPLFLTTKSFPPIHALLSNLDCFPLDFCARQKIGGGHLTYFILKQLPIFPPSTYSDSVPWSPSQVLAEWLLPRVIELTYTAWDLKAFALDCGYDAPPFRYDDQRCFLIRCELDAAFFHLYGINRDNADYIMDTFPIVRRKDEATHGDYRTKRVILELYDSMRTAIDTRRPYTTRLDPPPADPRVAHPARTELETRT
jgi:hypothetical protein